MNHYHNPFLGTISIVLGIFLLAIAVWPLLSTIFWAIGAIWLINFGLRLKGQPPLPASIFMWKNKFRM